MKKVSIILFLLLLFTFGGLNSQPKEKVIIFHAGSLAVFLEKLEQAFEQEFPALLIERESSGSLAAVRKVTELKKPCDLLFSSDYNLIDRLLIPDKSDFNIIFASNRMVLLFREKSKKAGEINSRNWYKILAEPGISWGHSDPNLDPCGYRSLMVLKLAEKYYRLAGLYNQILANPPQTRPKEVDLLSLLESGNLDYAWEYASVAREHNLKFVSLPPQINLGDPKYNRLYNQVKLEVKGGKPGETLSLSGETIFYGCCRLKEAPNPKGAELFLKFLLDPAKGRKLLSASGFSPVVPAYFSSRSLKEKISPQIKLWLLP